MRSKKEIQSNNYNQINRPVDYNEDPYFVQPSRVARNAANSSQRKAAPSPYERDRDFDLNGKGGGAATGRSSSNGRTNPAGSGGTTGRSSAGGRVNPAGSSGITGRSSSNGRMNPAGSGGTTGRSSSNGRMNPAGSGGTTGRSNPNGRMNPAGSGGTTGRSSSNGRTNPAGSGGTTGRSNPNGRTNPAGSSGIIGRSSAGSGTRPPSARTTGGNDGDSSSKDKKKDKKSRKKTRFSFKRFFLTMFLAVFAAGLVAAAVLGIKVYGVVKSAPDITPSNIYSLLTENSFMYDADGNLLEKVMDSELRTNLSYSEMPADLINAFVSIEDKTFWDHNGFNFVRIFGAVWESLRGGGDIKGTSTITQQLARNLYLSDIKSDRTLVRKATEAYYAMVLEKNLTKEQIIEAYLNTIHLGFNTYGVEAASQTYFGKPANQMTLAECAALATIPKSPSKYALIKRIYNENLSTDTANEDILLSTNVYTLIYNNAFKERQKYVLDFMTEYGYISQEQNDEAYNYDLRQSLHPSETVSSIADMATYFIDYAKNEAIQILMEQLNISREDAQDMLYNGGLEIHTTVDPRIEKIVETEFENNSNFPGIRGIRKDKSGNIVDSKGVVMLYNKSSYFDKDGNFVLNAGDYAYDDYGNLYIYKDHNLNINPLYSNDQLKNVDLAFKNLYTYIDSKLHIINSGWLGIDATYKSLDSNGNAIIHKEFLDANPDFFVQSGDSLKISSANYYLNDAVIQPQSAMVIIDQSNGTIKAMVGGRGVEGSQIYNRANAPRQPGSSIKPLAVYLPAMLNGYTAGTSIEDSQNVVNGKVWPRNAYSGYKGWLTIRRAIQFSSNVVAVRVVNAVGYETSAKFLEDIGITTLTKDDMNPAALGLGGMTKGLKPIESAGAYATIASGGVYNKPTTINQILNKNDEVIYDLSKNYSKRVFDEGTAYIMTDMLKGVVTSGTGSRARLYGGNTTIPVAGKTGTTTDNYDTWFCGYTPYYTASLWIGNDVNIELTNGSGVAAQLWSKIMKQVHEGYEAKNWEKPDSVYVGSVKTQQGTISELFVEGTNPPKYTGGGKRAVTICNDTGLLATDTCPSTRTLTDTEAAPSQSCTLHPSTVNGDTPLVDPNGDQTQVPDGLDPTTPSAPDSPGVDYAPDRPTTPATNPVTPPSTDPNPGTTTPQPSDPPTPSVPEIPDIPVIPSEVPDGV